ncbi:MAG: phytase [Bacteroidales bacterium]|nr:phytase [Bacteroidales bacterium]
MKSFITIFSTGFLFSVLFSACNPNPSTIEPSSNLNQDSLDFIEDSIEYVETLKIRDAFLAKLTADLETAPVEAYIEGDAADDPAIWYDASNPMNSKIIGTDKKSGLVVYNMSGEVVHYHKFGRMNNVDIRQDIPFSNAHLDILVASNRSRNSLDIFSIDKSTGQLTEISESPILISTDTIDDVYGVCLYYNAENQQLSAFINGTNGVVLQFVLTDNGSGKIRAKRSRMHQFSSQVEGMVADDFYGFLYVGQEESGLYKVDVEPEADFNPQLISNSSESNENLKYDLEGVSLYKSSDSAGYLVVSSQGNYSYAIFDRQSNNPYLGSIVIVDDAIDGAEETDGLDVISLPFGDKFPNGFLVVQDGFNYDGTQKKAQNFKVINWQKVQQAIDSFSAKN